MLHALKVRWDSLEGSLFPYALTSSLVMTLAPAFVILVIFFSQDPIWMEQMMKVLMRFLPEELLLQAFDYIKEESVLNQPLFLFFGVTLWIASKSPAHFLMLNKKEHHSHIPNWMIRVLSVWITLEMTLLLFIGALFVRIFKVNVMIASEVFLIFGLFWFYRRVSLAKSSIKEELFGTVSAFIGINGIGFFFFFYINEIALTHSIYGPLSSLVIVLLSCFAVSNTVFLGYSMNEIMKQNNSGSFHYPLLEKLGEKSWKCRSRRLESTEKASDI